LLEVDWSFNSPIWKGVMVNPRGNISNKAADRNLAADIAVWLVCGKGVPVGFEENLRERFSKQHNRADAVLPKPLEF
jgi:hypothetical protein